MQQGSHSDSMEKLKPYRQAKLKRIQHHQTRFTTNAKVTSLGNTREGKDLQKQTQNNSENGNRNIHIDNYLKCKWIKCSNQKTYTGWVDTKTRLYICCLQETHFRPRDTYRLKVRGWKKIFHVNGNQNKAGVAILISDKIDFKISTITRDKEEHYTMTKGSIQEEDIKMVNIYAPKK